jgi:hypothetical protein
MPVNHQLRCIFVHIPKTGGTSIERTLDMFGDWRIEDAGRLYGLIASRTFRSAAATANHLQHLTAAELRDLLAGDFDAYFKFSFVRNPWDRFVSSFGKKDPNLLECATNRGIHLAGVSFKDYVRLTRDLKHPHLQPQCEFLFDRNGKSLVDFLGRFETLVEDYGMVARRLGLQLDLPHHNASEHAPYRSYYDDADREEIASRYAQDIQVFGYRF